MESQPWPEKLLTIYSCWVCVGGVVFFRNVGTSKPSDGPTPMNIQAELNRLSGLKEIKKGSSRDREGMEGKRYRDEFD